MKYLRAAVIAATALLLGYPAQASADDGSYISRLQDEIPTVLAKYGDSQMLKEGYRVCSLLNSGKDEHAVMHQVQSDMPMSFSAASWVVILSEGELGC